MGLRFRKSIKIAPGLKLNLNKNSIGLSAGVKGARVSVNSKGKVTKSVGIPGSGISYVTTSSIGGKKKNTSNSSAAKQNSNLSEQASPKKGGCLKYILGFLIFCLAVALIPFVWIPCLIYLIFFRNKIDIEPNKRKIYNIIAIIIAIISFILMIFSFITPKLETLSINIQNVEMDVNTEQEVTLSFAPEGADISGVVIEVSDETIATISNENDKYFVTTSDKEGTVKISARNEDGTIRSNNIDISVIDTERIEAEKKAQEEAAAKAEAEKKAQEEAERKAQEEAAAQTATQTETQETMVWVSATGSKYHSKASCSNMKSPTEITLSEAEARNLTPCSRCY